MGFAQTASVFYCIHKTQKLGRSSYPRELIETDQVWSLVGASEHLGLQNILAERNDCMNVLRELGVHFVADKWAWTFVNRTSALLKKDN